MKFAFFDTKPYDIPAFEKYGAKFGIQFKFFETKLNEDTERTTLEGAVNVYKEREPRGEYVLVIEGGNGNETEENPLISLSPEEHVAHYEKLGMKRMDAIKAAAKDRGMSKSDFYKLVI